MDLGILFIGGDATVLQQTAIAKQAAGSGFDSLYMAEAYRSAWVPLTAMAAATSKVRLGIHRQRVWSQPTDDGIVGGRFQ